MGEQPKVYFDLKEGKKYSKSELSSGLYKIRLSSYNSMRFFAVLQRAGIVEVRGKTVFVKKNFQL